MALKAYKNGNYTVVISDKDESKYRVLPDQLPRPIEDGVCKSELHR